MKGFAFSRRSLLASALALGTTWATGAAAMGAAAGPTPRSPAMTQDNTAVAPIRELVASLLQIMRQGEAAPFERRFDILAPVIDQTFDLATILQQSIGFAWQALPRDQQAKLLVAFRRYTVASYVNSFNSFDGQRLNILPTTRAVGAGEQIVQTRIIPRSGDGHSLDYVMRQQPMGWRVVDVLADGTISRVAVQRSDFRRLLGRGGATALAETLQQKTASLVGAAG